MASYGFSPGSEGSGWLFGIGELWAGVRWGLGRDRPWSHQNLPQMQWVQGELKVSTLQDMDSGGRAVALYREFGDERDVTRGCSCLR